MRFSIWPNPARPTAEILELAQLADTDGWYGFWFADHYMPNTADDTVDSGDLHEAWAVLPAIAATTSNIRLGPLVSPTTVHHPAVLANRAATLDHLSNGRFVLGLGAGWQVNEHRAFGIDLLDPAERVDRFEEAIAIIASMLTNESTTVSGRHFTITDAPCMPKPVQSPLPLLVGTGGSRMLRITATYAQEWNTWGTPATVREVSGKLERACEAVGRDRSTIWTSAQPLVFITDDDAATAKLRDLVPADRSIVGTIPEIIDAINEYASAGVDELIIPDFTLGGTPQERFAAYARIRSEIFPAFA